MRNTIGIEDVQFEREIERFLDFTGKSHWKEVIQQFDITEGIYYKCDSLMKRNPLIIPIKQYFTLYEGGKSIWKNRTLEIDYLARIAFQINHILKRVNDQARKEIKGRLRSDDPRSVL
jgi:hypothetical protein